MFNAALGVLGEEDRQLGAIEHMLPILKRGIGVHHSGLLPLLKVEGCSLGYWYDLLLQAEGAVYFATLLSVFQFGGLNPNIFFFCYRNYYIVINYVVGDSLPQRTSWISTTGCFF